MLAEVKMGRHAWSLPSPEIYNAECEYWPWGWLLRRVAEVVCSVAPRRGLVIDYMCGTGFLLTEIRRRRPDLALLGCDRSSRYVAFARRQCRSLRLCCCDAFAFEPRQRPDVVICTGGLHHLSPVQQVQFVAKVARELAANGCFVLGEEVLSPFATMYARWSSVLALHRALFSQLIMNRAPWRVLSAGMPVLLADLLRLGEHKRTKAEIVALLQPYFEMECGEAVWPGSSQAFGDYLFVATRSKSRRAVVEREL